MRRIFQVAIVAFAVAFTSVQLLQTETALDAPGVNEDTRWIANRPWASHYPTDRRDIVRWLIPAQKNKKRFGLVRTSSAFYVAAERFVWRLEGPVMSFQFLQSQKKARVRVRARPCKVKHFDLCLELKQGRNSGMLYSRKKWRLDEGVDNGLFQLAPFDEDGEDWPDAPAAGEADVLELLGL